MVVSGLSIYMLAKVIIVFILLYLFLPSRLLTFDQDADGFWDKVFISLTHSTLLTIVVVHTLAFLRLYETFSLVFAYLLIYLLINRVKGKSWSAILEALGLTVVVQLLDISEGRTGFLLGARDRFSFWVKKKWAATRTFTRKFIKEPFFGLFPALIICAAAFIRFRYSICFARFSYADPYEHLIWAKYLGLNQLYVDDIYQLGYHTVISALAELFLVDPYWIVRFIGPLAAVLLLLSVYYFALKVTRRNYVASLLCLMVYGLVTHADFPSLFYRQTTALPMEFAAIFILPGLYFLWLYFNTGRLKYLILFSETYAITVFVHLYASLYFTIWVCVFTGVALLVLKLNVRLILKAVAGCICAGTFAMLPIGIGLLSGAGFWGAGMEYIQESISPKTGGHPFFSFDFSLLTHNLFLDITIPVLLLLVFGWLVKKLRSEDKLSLAVGATAAVGLVLYRAPELGLPTLTETGRTGVFLAPLLAVLYSSGLDTFQKLLPAFPETIKRIKVVAFQVLVLGLCLLIIRTYPPTSFFHNVTEYDAAARNYLAIKEKYPALDWTIVAPTEQYQQAYGSGWHYEILRFVQDFTPEEVSRPDFQLPIPTHHIFVFTEKIPLGSERRITEADASRELEKEGDNPFNQFYRDPDQRTIVEAKAVQLMESYRKTHQGVEIFYEDREMKIYYIYQQEVPELQTSG